MSTTEVLGRPASHARSLAVAALRRSTALACAAAAAVWLVAPLLLAAVPDQAQTLPWARETLAAAAALAVARTTLGPWHRARAGVRAEDRVSRALRRCGVVAVVNGSMLDGRGGDADHIVLGPVAALVETKHGRGRVRVSNGSVRAGRKTLPRNPIAQARRQASKASRIVGVTVAPVVCIVDMTNGPVLAGDVMVCSSRDLPKVLASLPKVLTSDRAARVAQTLHGMRD